MSGLGLQGLVLWSRRLSARAVDSALFSLVPALLELLFLRLVAISDSAVDLNWSFFWGLAAGFYKGLVAPAVLVAASFAYEVVWACRSGQTLGKRWLGLRVVQRMPAQQSAATEHASFGRLSSRWVVLHVPTIAMLMMGWLEYPAGDRRLMLYGAAWFGVVVLPALVSRSRRGVHDWVAGTVVVSAPSGWERPGRRGPGDEGLDRWQGFMRGDGPES